MSVSADSAQDLIGQISRRPAVPLAAALMLGIFAHAALPVLPSLYLSLLAGLIVAAGVTFRRPTICTAVLLAATALAGAAAAQIQFHFYPADHISAFATDQPRLAQVELSIRYPPRILSGAFGEFRALPPRQVVTATVRRVKTWNGWQDCAGEMLVQIAQPHPRLRQGQIVRVLGMLQRPAPAMNPGQFDWAAYYRQQRVLASLQIPSADNVTILQQKRIGPVAWLRQTTRQALAAGFTAGDSLDHALLRALLLGDNDPELRDVQEQFRRTGTSHHLAISGMHVAVLGGVVFGACRLLRTGPRAACWAALVFVVVYGLVALPSPPVVRSVLLCAAFGVGILQRRRTDTLQLLAVSVVAMLVYDPLDLYNAGFQLSFGMVLGLMLFTRPLMDALPGGDRDVDLALAMQMPGAFSVIHQGFRRHVRAAAAAAIVAWFVAIPLIAFHFQQLNPWAIPASIILAPVVFAALVGGFAKVLLTLLWPGWAGTWATAAVGPVAAMRQMVDWLGLLPGSDVPLASPPVWAVVMFYVFLVTMLIHWPRRAIGWPARGAALVGCAALVALPVHDGVAAVAAPAGELRVTLLAVGAGQCVAIQPPDADVVLVDAGSMTLADVMRKAVAPFLRQAGRRGVGSVIVSHANYDHFSAVGEVVAAYEPGTVFMSPQFASHSADNPPAERLLRELDAMDRPPRIMSRGDSIDIGGGAKVDVLWPPADCDFDADNCSLVLRLQYADRSILFTGDLKTDGMGGAMERPEQLRADVLVAPHHGSMERATSAFVEAVNPQVIVCSSDRTPSGKQRDFDRAMSSRQVLRTNISGAITIRIGRNGALAIDEFLAPRR